MAAAVAEDAVTLTCNYEIFLSYGKPNEKHKNDAIFSLDLLSDLCNQTNVLRKVGFLGIDHCFPVLRRLRVFAAASVGLSAVLKGRSK